MKKAEFQVEPADEWVELIGFFLLIVGFIFAIGTSVILNYILIGLAGLIFGRAMARCQKHSRVPTLLIMFGFVGGFLIGAFGTNRRVILIVFALTAALSFYAHRKGWISSVEI